MSDVRRKKLTSQEKVKILKRHFIEKTPVSNLCDEYSIHPSIFYRWQQKFFKDGASIFETQAKSVESDQAKKIETLEKRLHHKNEVLSELMEEYITLKKNLGAS